MARNILDLKLQSNLAGIDLNAIPATVLYNLSLQIAYERTISFLSGLHPRTQIYNESWKIVHIPSTGNPEVLRKAKDAANKMGIDWEGLVTAVGDTVSLDERAMQSLTVRSDQQFKFDLVILPDVEICHSVKAEQEQKLKVEKEATDRLKSAKTQKIHREALVHDRIIASILALFHPDLVVEISEIEEISRYTRIKNLALIKEAISIHNKKIAAN